MEWTDITLESLTANCPDLIKAIGDAALTGFDSKIEELEAQIQEAAAVEPEPETQTTEEEVVAESETAKLAVRLAAVEMRERQADAREVLQASLSEADMTDAGKALVERRFTNAAPEDKAKFAETVKDEIKAMADHEKAIAESVRLPGTPGVISEVGRTERVDVKAVIASMFE